MIPEVCLTCKRPETMLELLDHLICNQCQRDGWVWITAMYVED